MRVKLVSIKGGRTVEWKGTISGQPEVLMPQQQHRNQHSQVKRNPFYLDNILSLQSKSQLQTTSGLDPVSVSRVVSDTNH